MKPYLFYVFLSVALIGGCGGGGGGGSSSGDNGGINSPPSSATAEITRESLPKFAGALVETSTLATSFLTEFGNPVGIPAFNDSYNGTETEGCSFGGTTSATTTGGGRKTTFSFNNCKGSSSTAIDGALIVEFTDPDRTGNYKHKITLERLSVTDDGYSSAVTGTISADIPYDLNKSIIITANLGSFSINSDVQFSTKELVFEHPHYSSILNFSQTTRHRGQIEINGIGSAYLVANLTPTGDQRVNSSKVTGRGQTLGNISTLDKLDHFVVRYFDGSKSYFSSHKTEFLISDIQNGTINFFSSVNSAPVKSHTYYPEQNVTIDPNEMTQVSSAKFFTTHDGGLLQYSIELNGDSNNYTINNWMSDVFDIRFEQPGVWSATAVATGPTGIQVRHWLGNITVRDIVDTDGDGVRDHTDLDDDNDGLNDFNDAFPLDNSEKNDFDLDGTGDNADTDDDNDLILDEDDAYPQNPNCSKPEDGNGTLCFLEIIGREIDYSEFDKFSQVEIDKNGTVYFISRNLIYRWDSVSNIFLPNIARASSAPAYNQTLYSKNLHRLYLLSNHEGNSYIELDATTPTEVAVALPPPSFDSSFINLIDQNYLIRAEFYPSGGQIFQAFDENLSATSTKISYENYSIFECTDFRSSGITIDQSSGQLIEFANSGGASDKCGPRGEADYQYPISPDRTQSIEASSGEVYRKDNPVPILSLKDTYDLPVNAHATWTANGIVFCWESYDYSAQRYATHLVKFSPDFNFSEEHTFNARLLKILGFNGTDFIIMLAEPNRSRLPSADQFTYRIVKYRP